MWAVVLPVLYLNILQSAVTPCSHTLDEFIKRDLLNLPDSLAAERPVCVAILVEPVGTLFEAHLGEDKIGRASCRERVYSNV